MERVNLSSVSISGRVARGRISQLEARLLFSWFLFGDIVLVLFNLALFWYCLAVFCFVLLFLFGHVLILFWFCLVIFLL